MLFTIIHHTLYHHAYFTHNTCTLPHRLGFCLTFPFRPVRNSHLWPAIVTNGMALEPLATEKVNLIDGPKALHFTMYVNV